MIFEAETHLTKNKREVTLRMVTSTEAQSLIQAMVEIASTSTYILQTADDFAKMKIEDEIKWIESYNNDPRSVLIIAESNNKIVGILDFRAYKNPKTRHRGGLGISLHHTVRGEGLGEILFKKLISEVKKVGDLSILELSVMSDNVQAYHLYKKVGFIEIGRKPKAYKQVDNTFNDEVMMVLPL